jgi:hypothetical protein
MAFIGLTDKQHQQLLYEVVPSHARLQLTRILRRAAASDNWNQHVSRMNRIINICRSVLGEPISIIQANDWGDYEFVDVGWIRSELEVSMRRPDTGQLVETLADLIQDECLSDSDVNAILEASGCSFTFNEKTGGDVVVDITPIESLEADAEDEVTNIRILVRRMDVLLENQDYAGVLHASASVFETLAKDVIAIPSIQNETLASFFDRYKKESLLPEPVLNYILSIYRRRNVEPLAGHGSLSPPIIAKEEATLLSHLTKAFVQTERQLSGVQVSRTIKSDKNK